ncbi:hypothetical protein M3603_06350 [Rummeliibacillus stabekisii]|uniref:hypothetical protein n=1 Tax=Rummeliibacillus stabekisii TaxID=241244 RepID=UPI0020411049|nr:hypothetical protein [Rummeliibacillus stabekisii]MCM3316296.1 hypothetical protein [Rummeliibacillus stabekisii]
MNKTIQERYFKKGQLLTIPKKEKNKLQILDIIIQRFKKIKYTQKKKLMKTYSKCMMTLLF